MAPSIDLEARPYGPGCTPDELAAIRERTSLHGGRVMLYREVPVASAFTVDVCFDRVEELIEAHGCVGMIVDVRDCERPDATTRRQIHARIVALEGRLRHVALITSPNPVIRVAAKFIQAALPVRVSVHATLAEAEEALRDVA